MSERLHIRSLSSQFNEFVSGCPRSWEWGGGIDGYNEGRRFFTVHWQINFREDKPQEARIIRLHVESPRYDVHPSLNELKREVIMALLSSKIERDARQHGYDYAVGAKISLHEIRRNKSTEALRVIVHEGLKATHNENIEAAHAALGNAVAKVVQTFADRLNTHFRS